jgi:hypothetical protein
MQDSDLATGNYMVELVKGFATAEGSSVVVVSAQVESELSGLEPQDRAEFLAELGVKDPSKVKREGLELVHSLVLKEH